MSTCLAISAGIIFLTVLVGFIIPEGKLNKTINFVVRLACIFILISPILKVFGFTETINNGSLVDYGYICSVYSENQSEQLEKLILEKLGIECECKVDFTYEDGVFKENGVTILTDFAENVTIEKIQAYLGELGYININVNEKDT